MSSKPRMFGKYPVFMVIGAFALAMGLAQPVRADALKIDGQWITQGVTIVRIADGKIIYSVRGSETEDQLANVQGIRLDAYPDLADAQKNLADGKPGEAVTQLRRVIAATSQQIWARQYAEKLLMQAFDQNNKPTEVVITFLKLANDKAPADYLATPPSTSLANASETLKKDIRARLTGAIPRLSDDAKPGAQLLLKAVGEAAEAPKPATPATPTSPPATPTTPAATTGSVAVPAAVAPATPATPATPAAAPADPNAPVIPAGLPKNIPVTYEGVKLFQDHKYEETLKWVDDQLKVAQQNFSFFFFLRGLALYKVAEKTDNKDMFLDAGVSFMKCAIYFPRDMYAGPAYLETARVYVKLGNLKQAKKLLNKALPMIMEEPGLEQKVEELQAALKDTGDAPAAAPKDNY